MAIDATVLRTIEEAKITARVDELKRHMREQPMDELSEGLKAQLEALGIPMTRGEGDTGVTSTSVILRLWNRDTGEPSNVRFDELEAHLRVRFDVHHATMAGELVWTDIPMEPKTRGVLRCPLHRDHPEREAMSALGMAHVSCRKANLVTDLDVEKHIQHRHPALHERLTRKRTEDMRQEQLDLMRQQTAALTALLERGVGPQTIAAATGVAVAGETPYQCGICHEYQANAFKLNAHIRDAHKKGSDGEANSGERTTP